MPYYHHCWLEHSCGKMTGLDIAKDIKTRLFADDIIVYLEIQETPVKNVVD